MPNDNLTKIIEELRTRKIVELADDLDLLKTNEPLPTVDLFKKLKQEESELKIETGTMVDKLIGGGLSPASSILIYGEYGSGKSQMCYTMSVECPNAVVVIDAENSFRAERIKEIAEKRDKDWETVFNKITLKQPQNWVQQLRCLWSIPTPPEVPTGKIGLIILDSLTKRFRGIEFAGRQSLYIKQPLIREFSFKLDRIVKAYQAGLIITTQVYEDPNVTSFLAEWTKFKAVGGSSLLHQPDFVLFLRRVKGQNVRIARMMDSSWQPLRECPFVITERGIDDLPPTAKARDALLKKAGDFEKRQKQEDMKKKEPKKKKVEETNLENQLLTQEET